MKPLVAIVSCHAYADRVKAIRETWLPSLRFPYKFFVGGPGGVQGEDVVQLDVDDGYRGLPAKSRAISRYALEHGFSHVFKCDDDVYLDGERLAMSASWERGDYVGRKRGPSGGFPAPYASGFSYWLSARAMKIIAEAELTDDPAEDRWTANTLLKRGMTCAPDYRYVVIDSRRNAVSHTEGPRAGNHVISACEFEPDRMTVIHWERSNKKSMRLKTPDGPTHPLRRVAILVKTFLRDGYLLRTVRGIQENLPESKIVIVDDGYESSFKISWYAQLRDAGHSCLWLPFDSGFGAKANAGVEECDREFVLIASDDFVFTPETRGHVTSMVKLLDHVPLDLVSGRVNQRPYESVLRIEDNGETVREIPGYHEKEWRNFDGLPYHTCDLTVNFSLVRRTLLDKVGWDGGECKIGGGEHGAFYLDIMKAGGKVGLLANANINEFPRGNTDWQHQTYNAMRTRARQPGRICLAKRGIKRWILQDGSVECTE